MLESLHWRGVLRSREAEEQLHELQTDALRLFLLISAVGCVIWYDANTLARTTAQAGARASEVLAVVALVLIGTYVLLSSSQRAAAMTFVVGGAVAIS